MLHNVDERLTGLDLGSEPVVGTGTNDRMNLVIRVDLVRSFVSSYSRCAIEPENSETLYRFVLLNSLRFIISLNTISLFR